MIKKYLHIVLIVYVFFAKAQNPQFTQYYALPLLLNPAFTGQTYEHRFTADVRSQWPGVATTYKSVAASYDYNMASANSGIGLVFLQDIAGTPSISSSLALLSYAYNFKINKTTEIRAGLQMGYGYKSIDMSKLVFNDQLYYNSATLDPYVLNMNTHVSYFDLNAGAMINSATYWFGFTAQHINTPNTSFSVDGDNKQPVDISLHGGYRFVLEKKGNKLKKFFSPTFNYKHERNFNQLDIGAYYFMAPINLGLWYRGIPFTNKPGSDAISLLVGVDLDKYDMRIGFSYDVTVSKLLVANSLGAFELSFIYEYAKRSKKVRKVLISCPKF
ncbi:MAG: PorP/SprF family type IX secretion system membrane protein [Bacteroidetes bacterium]|nr:PorP/SprF family type IX secretion system membrane protein [Bacteroidota bacterium]